MHVMWQALGDTHNWSIIEHYIVTNGVLYVG